MKGESWLHGSEHRLAMLMLNRSSMSVYTGAEKGRGSDLGDLEVM